jgi:alpha-beta hydrolase superfamily lysophospholipase
MRGYIRALAAATGGVTSVLVGSGVYTSRTVNMRRKRYYTDDFHMTPETLSMPFEAMQFTTDDGIVLRGWWIRQSRNGVPSKRAIVLCSPYNSDKSNLLGIARGLWDSGNSVFLFDNRSHAASPTKQTVGYLEQLDARAAVDALVERISDPRTGAPTMRIGFCGASMGGAMAIITAHTLPPALREHVCGVVSDCAFHDFDAEVRFRVTQAFPLVPRPILDAVMIVARAFNAAWYGWNFADVSPSRVVAAGDGNIPLLIVHSVGDHVVPVSDAQVLFEAAATTEKKLWLIPGCDHIGGYFRDSHAYNRKVVNFFETCDDLFEEQQRARERVRDLAYAEAAPAQVCEMHAVISPPV